MNKNENPSFLGSMILTVASGLVLIASFSSAKPNPLLAALGVLIFLIGLALAVRSAYLATQPVEASDTANRGARLNWTSSETAK